MDPRTGQILTVPGAANTQAAIGTPIPGTGNLLNGIKRAGDGIAETGYVWPTLVIGPRFGMAYDLTGNQDTILRAGGGLYYDRPDGNTVFSIPGNPPLATARDLRNGQLQTLGQGLAPVPVPALITFQYDAKVPASWQWQAGVQRALPWSTAIDVSYVGNHGFNRLGSFQGGTRMNLNAVDIGAAYLPQNQDPTLAPSTVPGANAYTTNLLRPYRGLGTIEQNTTEFCDTYHSMQFSLTRRFRNGFSFGANYTLGLSFTGNTGLVKRLQHNADGSFSLRADQAEYEELNKNLDMRPHFLKANAIWATAERAVERLARVAGYILNDWQIAGVLTAGSGQAYDLTYNYQNNGGEREPDRLARLRRTDRLHRRPGQRLFGRSVPCSSTPRRSPVPHTAASVWSRDATSCGRARTRSSTSRCRVTFASGPAARWSSGSTCSTRSIRSSSTIGRTKFSSSARPI